MRTLAIGDIHGGLQALQTLEKFVPFRPSDRIITLGDYIDRGPRSRQVIDWIRERTLSGQCLPLRGNHEVMMLWALAGEMPLSDWLAFGGKETLVSYGAEVHGDSVVGIPSEHIDFLTGNLLPWHETERQIFVHASVVSNLPLTAQPDDILYWDRFEKMQPHQSGKTVICGHTAQHSGEPADRGFALCIDTWLYGGGWLTCLDVDTFEYWQSNSLGETRSGRLREAPGP